MINSNANVKKVNFGNEWRDMAKDTLKKSSISDNPALNRLKSVMKEGLIASDIGCYSRMHHRHNR